MIAIYSGTSAPRVYEPEPAREQTRQFRSPVFDHSVEEFQARRWLMEWHRRRSPIARARLATIAACYYYGTERLLLNAFDQQAREALGVPL